MMTRTLVEHLQDGGVIRVAYQYGLIYAIVEWGGEEVAGRGETIEDAIEHLRRIVQEAQDD